MLFGVEVLKNAFQSAVMSATADGETALLDAAGVAGGVTAEGALVAGAAAAEAVEVLEEQADRATTPRIRPSIGIAR
ncbi:MAG TPA: hypothetical protein VFE59_29180 [Trebonia sp.]|nr:hypothetical protein [Trebonia sp.]